MFPICSILPSLPPIKIIDVGAMDVGEGEDPHAALLRATPCEVIGFEPVTDEFENLNRESKKNHRFLPFFVGDGSTRIFHECNFPMTSSLFEPNTALVAKFQNLEELMRVVKVYPVETKRLDDIPEVRGADLLKVDVQGAELMVFRGAVDVLKDVLVVQTEVEFLPLYKEQPLFSEVDAFLRDHGFQFHRMSWMGRTFKPLIANNNINAPMSQQLWADAIYVRDFMAFDRLAAGALLKLACILHEAYRSFDLAALALESYDRQTGAQINRAYIERLITPNTGS